MKGCICNFSATWSAVSIFSLKVRHIVSKNSLSWSSRSWVISSLLFQPKPAQINNTSHVYVIDLGLYNDHFFALTISEFDGWSNSEW